MKTNYLVGLNKQLQYAVDNGLQEAYEFGVLIEQCLDLVDPGEDDSGADNEDDEGNSLDGDEVHVGSGDELPRGQGATRPDGPVPRSGTSGNPPGRVAGLRPCLAERTDAVRSGRLAGALGGTAEGLQSAFPGVKAKGTRGTR